MPERAAVNKRPQPKSLRDLLRKVIAPTFAKQGFASAELVTRWPEIVGAEIAAHSEPMRIQWPRPVEGAEREPGTLVLRVEGPAAIEVQHCADLVCDRVNRFLGWRAVDRIALRQAPLRRRALQPASPPDAAATAQVAATLTAIGDEQLRQALARLGAAVKQS